MTDRFHVSSEDLKLVYTETIEPLYFSRSSPATKPHAFIVGGQPGCGKTRVLDNSKRTFEAYNVVIVNTDDLRAYHPKFEEIIHVDDKVSAQHTHEAVSTWNQMLLSRSIETRRNIILEAVLKD